MKTALIIAGALILAIVGFDFSFGKDTQTHATCSALELSADTGNIWYQHNC